jgi:FkbH-like protein
MLQCLEYPFDSEYLLKKKKSIKRQLLEQDSDLTEKKIAVLGGSTTNEVIAQMELFLLNMGIRPRFYESEYNQFYQDAMFQNEELEQFAPELIYIHTSNRNITAYPKLSDTKEEIDRLLDVEMERFEGMWERLRKVYGCPIIQNNFEYPFYRLLGNKDASDIHGRIHFISALNERFYQYAQCHENFYINDIQYLSACYGIDRWSDPLYWHLYKYCCALPAIPELSYNIVRIIKSLYGKNKKGLVLDLDNTLWGGVVGDDGVEQLEIGQETSMGQVYLEFQEYLKAQKDLGILLTVDSKNEYENAIAGLNHPDGVLKPDDFVSIKANWNPKDANLIEIAGELTLLPESMVFVDDNPAERAIVRAQVPGAAVPELGNAEHYIQVLDKAGYFEVTNLSADDAKRSEMYKENAKRKEMQASFGSYEEYLRALDMHAVIRPFEELYISRITQLTNKSNQFNLTTRRYAQPELEQISQNAQYVTLYGKLSDRFGDNGVVSVVIAEQKEDALHIDLWLMSCRVLKRDMEYAMMDALVQKAQERGAKGIYGYYYPTAKNAMVKDFYALQGFEQISENQNGDTVWYLDLRTGYENKNKVIQVEE